MKEEIPVLRSKDLQNLFKECKDINSKLHESIIELINYSKEICEEECLDEFEELELSEDGKLKVLRNDRNSREAQ